jgi:hypothetical protein
MNIKIKLFILMLTNEIYFVVVVLIIYLQSKEIDLSFII